MLFSKRNQCALRERSQSLWEQQRPRISAFLRNASLTHAFCVFSLQRCPYRVQHAAATKA
jgi:hypothetical protein